MSFFVFIYRTVRMEVGNNRFYSAVRRRVAEFACSGDKMGEERSKKVKGEGG